MPVNVAIDGDAGPFWEQGKELYYTRVGQLDMACANCHEDNYGNMIRADHLSTGSDQRVPGLPVEKHQAEFGPWPVQGLHEHNIRNDKPYKEGSPEFIALELYLSHPGGNGLSVESPSVRN